MSFKIFSSYGLTWQVNDVLEYTETRVLEPGLNNTSEDSLLRVLVVSLLIVNNETGFRAIYTG